MPRLDPTPADAILDRLFTMHTGSRSRANRCANVEIVRPTTGVSVKAIQARVAMRNLSSSRGMSGRLRVESPVFFRRIRSKRIRWVSVEFAPTNDGALLCSLNSCSLARGTTNYF